MKRIFHGPSALLLAAGLAWTPQLVHSAPGAPVLSMTPSVASPKSGQPVDLTFKVQQDGTALTDFDVVHDKTSHLMLVSSDYSDFQHVHPTLDGNGTFRIEDVVFHRPGPYYVFLDVTPQGSKQIVKRFDFKVQGTPKPLVLSEDLKDKGWQGLRVRLLPMPQPLKKGDAMLHFQLTRDGQPVQDLKPYMGAMGHVVALGKDGKPFLHIHPLDEPVGKNSSASPGASSDPHAGHNMGGAKPATPSDPHAGHGMTNPPSGAMKPSGLGQVAFHATFPSAGLYKVWGQFWVGDAVIIAPFTLRVQ